MSDISGQRCSRIRQVQALLKDSGNSVPDCILCSLGIDSRYNEGCSELASYLFFGLYKHDQEQIPEDFPEEVLDDVIIMIKAESVHLYCNPVNYPFLLPYVSHWRNLHLHCMTEAEYEDEEAAEEFKISSFVSMVEDCSCVGIPYSSRSHVQKFDVFMLEKWPIIQAFALDGIGAGGFFTMKYKLTDVSEQLWQTYSRLDPVSLDCLLSEDLPLFERQWSCLFSSMRIESALSMQELSEAQTAEPFRTYYSHGLISSNITDSSKSRQPFVLFGSHSSKEDLNNYCYTFPSEAHQVRNTGARGGAAKHMLLQCVAPKGPLACARTYFFGSTHVPYLEHDNTQQMKTELLLLSQIYSAAVQSVLAGIKCFSINSSTSKARDVAEQTFQLTLDRFGLLQYRSALRSKAVFSIQAVNEEGRVIPLSDEQSRFLVKTASMVVYDIPDLQWGGEDLGSVVFSESFLESSIYIQERDGALSTDSSFTVLTSSIPRHVCWLVDESDVRLSERALRLLKEENGTCLGVPLTTKDSAQMFSSSLLSTPEEGKLVFFSEGLLFVHPHYGTITLSKNHISTIKLRDGDSLSAAAVLFIEYESALLPHLPFPLHSPDRCLAITLMPKSKGYKAFYSKVLQVWSEPGSGLRVQHVSHTQLSLEQKSMHSRLLKIDEMCDSTRANPRARLTTTYPGLPDMDRFLKHFAVSSSVCEESVCSDHLAALFPNIHPKPVPPEPQQQVILYIIAGLPGSHKESLCDFLVEVNQECGKWEVYHPSQESEDLCIPHLQQFLSNLVVRQNMPHLNTTRVLIPTPGYTDVLDVVQAVVSHPDPRVQSNMSVGAVTACVNPQTSFMEHRFLFPKLLEQCSHGAVNNVVFTGLTAEQKHPLLKHMQQLIRSANPSAALILAERGAVSRAEDMRLILSDSGFSQPQMIRARYLLYPGWWEGRFVSGCGSVSVSRHCVQFSRPLERILFLQHCKALKCSLRGNPFTGNIYHLRGRVLFSDCDRLMDVSCDCVSGTVTVAPDQGFPPSATTAHPCYLIIHGVGLTQEGLKTWLRRCAKEKATKKVRKTKRTLSPQEIKNIHVKRHLEPLPAGYFYNGHQFVSFFGEKLYFHPLMDQFIEEYLQEANEEIERFNRDVDLRISADLFD
ncbi:dynein axonemal assembly factor 9 isoform X2 [Brachyhypopomus gauderio]|uniref:dynein axonemal assembly factor 9 isoform X2 n=1 Tax=Brachyhypopomus gauderio TaxID=698409 RepID=UPI0040424265